MGSKNTDRGHLYGKLLPATCILAACSLAYELLIAQTIAVFAGNTVVWYSLIIGVFLLGMGAGSLLLRSLTARYRETTILFWAECGLCLLGVLASPLLHLTTLSALWQSGADNWFANGALFFITGIALACVIGVLSGMELPLLMNLARIRAPKLNSSNLVLAADYIGSLLGALVFAFVLWPHFDPLKIGAILAGTNLLVAAIIAPEKTAQRRNSLRTISVALLAGTLTFLYASSELFEQFFLRRYYAVVYEPNSIREMISPNEPLPFVRRVRSPYQTIDLVRRVNPDRSYYLFDTFSSKFSEQPHLPKHWLLFLNGEVQFFGDFEEVYHEFFAHVPPAALGTVPKRVLILGGGDGFLLREILKYQEVDSVTLVDLDEKMIAFARSNTVMTAMNQGAFEDARVRVQIEDAYHYIRKSQDTFDAIYLDFPEIADYNIARLYSREFYHFVRNRLSPNGFAALNAGAIEYLSIPDEHGKEIPTGPNEWDALYTTFRSAGFEQITPFYSRLEFDNDAALKRTLELNLMGIKPDIGNLDKLQAAKRFLRYNSASLRSGFVFLSNSARELQADFQTTASPLFVLNEKRFTMSLRSPLEAAPTLVPSKVHSVFKPRAHRKHIWSIRRPIPVYGNSN